MRNILLVAALATTTIASAQSAAPEVPHVIDAHWHADLAPGDLDTAEAKSKRQKTMAELDAMNVSYLVVNGVPDAIAVWRKEFPDRVIPALLFPCENGKAPNWGRACFPGGAVFPDIGWLREEVKAGRIRALGEITAQYLGIPPDDPRLEPYFALAEEFDIPVLIHLGLGPPGAAYPSSPAAVKSPNFRATAGSPLLLEDVLLRHKRLRVSIMHAGWPLIDETIYVLYQHPQVYVDVAVLQWAIPRPAFHAALRRIVEAGYADRVMLGSDSGVSELRQGIEAIQQADYLTDEQRTAILYDNAVRFFRLQRETGEKTPCAAARTAGSPRSAVITTSRSARSRRASSP